MAEGLRIRMYRVGFGDCFLLTLPTASGPRHVLIDCGVHGRGNPRTIAEVVEDVLAEANGHLSLVIGSHPHQDHLSGFATCAARFGQTRAQEVWMPWTENPQDKVATNLRKKRLALVERLREHLTYTGGSDGAMAVMENLSGNQKALQVLRSGFAGDPVVRYLEAGTELKDAAGIAGLTARILGPPRDPEFLAKMNPPAAQRYLRLEEERLVPVNAVHPFARQWEVPVEKYRRAHSGFTAADERRFAQDVVRPLDALAFTLDQVVNNTSLAVLFGYRGKSLLFPGDAQWGNWKGWLEKDGAHDLLGELSFYKVSHHGSHNATPKGALEAMTTGQFAAMCSTQGEPWPSIPQPRLMDALDRKTRKRVVRSDSVWLPNAVPGPAAGPLPAGFTQGKLWLDYALSL